MSDLKGLLAKTIYKNSKPSNPDAPSRAQGFNLLSPTQRKQRNEEISKQLSSFDDSYSSHSKAASPTNTERPKSPSVKDKK